MNFLGSSKALGSTKDLWRHKSKSCLDLVSPLILGFYRVFAEVSPSRGSLETASTKPSFTAKSERLVKICGGVNTSYVSTW